MANGSSSARTRSLIQRNASSTNGGVDRVSMRAYRCGSLGSDCQAHQVALPFSFDYLGVILCGQLFGFWHRDGLGMSGEIPVACPTTGGEADARREPQYGPGRSGRRDEGC